MSILGVNGVNANSYCKIQQQKQTQQVKNNNKNVPTFDLGGCSNQKKQYDVFLKDDDMLYSGGNGTGLSFYLKYADNTTDNNPIVIAKGLDEYSNEFEQKIYLNNINPKDATIVEMQALEAHYNVDKGLSLSSLPNESGFMGLTDRSDFLNMFETVIKDMNTLGRYDLSAFYFKNLQFYSHLSK